MRPVTLRVCEGARFALPPHLATADLREKLIRRTEGLPGSVLTYDRRGLRAGNVVGLVDFGPLRLEILPKVTPQSAGDQDAQFLIDLLAGAGLVRRSAIRAGKVLHTPGGAMEQVIGSFASQLFDRLVDGLPRRYALREEWSSVIKGRLNFSALAHRMPGRDHLVPIRYSPLQTVNPLTILIRSLIDHLTPVCRSVPTRSILVACAQLLGEIPSTPLTADLVARVHLSPLESDWEDIIEFATALAAGAAPHPTSAGTSRFFTLLFPLEDLFERVLRHSLRRALEATDLELANTGGQLYLLHSLERSTRSLPLRPDFLIQGRVGRSGNRLVADAKWKRLDPAGRSLGLIAADVYQILTYMASYSLDRGVLFFPRSEWMPKNWSHGFSVLGREASVRVAGVDLPALVSRNRAVKFEALSGLRSFVIQSASSA